MKFNNHKIEEFLLDESFFNWVKRKSKSDIAYWEAWWKDNPQHHHSAQEAINLINAISFKNKGFSSKENIHLLDKIKDETIRNNQTRDKTRLLPSKISGTYFLKVAAVIVPLIIGTIYYLDSPEMPQDQISSTQELIVKEIPRGQKLTVYLPDGSMVKLNSESKISYSKPFDNDERLVTLEGEAFFEVTPDTKRPFRVVSKGVETTVVGTSFNINAYSDKTHVAVSVVSGKVTVQKAPSTSYADDTTVETITLSPSEQATFFEDNKEIAISGYSPNQVLGWSDGILYFNNASMEELVAELERWYGIDIILKRDIPIKKGFVGEFHNQSLEEIMIGMHVASEFEYAFENGKLIIK